MTHQEIEQRDIVESYLRGRLADADRQAFEEHFFACEECFAELRTAGHFIDGVRHAAEVGLLPQEPPESTAAAGRWWQPAFGFGWAAAALLLIATAWLGLVEVPRGRRELARQSAAIESERGLRRDLEKQLALEQLAMARPAGAEGNIPVAMLEASRAGEANDVTIPPGASRLVLWMELGPAERFSEYRLQIRNQAGSTLETVEGLKRNKQGALAASVPAPRLPAGTYTVLLQGAGPGQDGLVAEYRLVVRR